MSLSRFGSERCCQNACRCSRQFASVPVVSQSGTNRFMSPPTNGKADRCVTSWFRSTPRSRRNVSDTPRASSGDNGQRQRHPFERSSSPARLRPQGGPKEH